MIKQIVIKSKVIDTNVNTVSNIQFLSTLNN